MKRHRLTTVKEFEYSEDGLDKVYEWICEQYEARKDEWDFALKNPLDKAKQMGLM